MLLQGWEGMMTVYSDAAYETAKHLIAEAKASGVEGLSLQSLRHLDVLPPELSELHKLTSLLLNDTQVSDLAPLAGLTALKNLHLNDNPISDLAPLAGLTGLTILRLWNTSVSDLAPLAGLRTLTTLHLNDTLVSDAVPLAGLTRLTDLSLRGTQVSDLAPLAGLTALKSLQLNDTPVSDLAPLAGLMALWLLELDNTLVSDLTPLSGLATLTTLHMDRALVSDLAPLAGLSALYRLSLSNTPVSDLMPLSGLKALTKLSLSDTPISDLTPLVGLTALTSLHMDRALVSDLAPLAGLSALTNLRLNGTPVSDLRPLRGLRLLVSSPSSDGLSISGSRATQIDPRIFQIAQIGDAADRALALFEHLEAWEPPVELPGQRLAPIMVEFDQNDRLVESPATTNLPLEIERRARGGWEALKEVHADVIETLGHNNLPNLERAMASFGRALGDSFEQMRPIPLGTHGQRIVEISKDARDVLIDDAAGDLTAFAAAIQTYLQRFPEWIEYLHDTAEDIDEGPPLQSAVPQLEAVSQALKDTDLVAPEIPTKLDDLIEAAKDADLPAPLVRRGTLGSISNIFSRLVEPVLSGRRLVGDIANEAYKVGITKTVGATGTVLATGVVTILKSSSQTLLELAHNYPQQLGWIEAVLRFLHML